MKVQEVAIATGLIVVLLVGTGLGYLMGSANERVATSTLTEVSTTVSTATVLSTTTSTTTFDSTIVLNYSSIPSQFAVGNYSIFVTQGVGYDLSMGVKVYPYNGFYTLFSIFPLTGGLAAEVPFFWNTTSGPSPSHLPYDGRCYALHSGGDGCPNSATSFVGTSGMLEIAWAKQNSTIWISFTFGSYP